MGNLNESIDRIKGMMKMIQESDFNIMGQLPNNNPDANTWELRYIINHVMAAFSENKYFDDSDVDLNDGFFSITDNEGRYELRYDFEVRVTSYGSYDPGDRDTPPYYEGPEWEIENLKLTIIDHTDDGESKQLYSGPDISEFEDLTFPGVKEGTTRSGAQLLYNEFEDTVVELIGDVEPDYPEPDYD